MSGILRYFHLVKEPSSSETAGLPDPNGPLSKVIPSSTSQQKIFYTRSLILGIPNRYVLNVKEKARSP